MMIIQSPVSFSVTTNLLTGIGSISIKIPGTFSGFPPLDDTQARYFSSIQIQADSPMIGDYIDQITLDDTDGAIPAPFHAQFSSYPTIIDFSIDDGIATGVKGGYYLDGDGYARIGSLDNTLQLLPSGLYLKARLNSTSARTFRVALIWGRRVNILQ